MCEKSFETHKPLCSVKMEDSGNSISALVACCKKIVSAPRTAKLPNHWEKLDRSGTAAASPVEVGCQVLSRPPASAPLWGRPRQEREGGCRAAEAAGVASASPSRAESTPGLRREGAGRAGPRGVAMETGWGARGGPGQAGCRRGDPRLGGLHSRGGRQCSS